MLLDSPLQELKRREAALKIIKLKVKEDRSKLYDLTGLSGGFPVKEEDISLLETYAGPAIFEEKLQPLGIEHLGGEKVLALNRTSSGILATILALVNQRVRLYTSCLSYLHIHPSPEAWNSLGEAMWNLPIQTNSGWINKRIWS